MDPRDKNIVISLKPSDAIDDTPPKPDEHQVIIEMNQLRVRQEATRRLDREVRGEPPLPEILTLHDHLRRPRQPLRWSIPGWQPANSRVMCAGQAKTGKTMLMGNYIRSRVDGDPWIDGTAVTPIDGTIVLIDCEMNASHLVDWLAAQRIRRDHRVIVIPLRGQVAAFDILDPRTRAWWATQLWNWEAQCVVLDCLRPVLDALGLDEHTEAGRLLVAFDALLEEASTADAVVIQHMGHLSERSRGDSRLRDWPDVEWRLMRQNADPHSPRFLSAYGRDVDQPEQQLAYDDTSRRLTVCGGSRKDHLIAAALTAIVAALAVNPTPRSGRTLKEELSESGHARNDLDKALHLGRTTGQLATTQGSKNAYLYSLSVSQRT